jgi:hypothetical protein
MLEGFDICSEYVSLYNHPQLYDSPTQTEMYKGSTSFWKTMDFTTNTFACKKETFLDDIDIHIETSTNVDSYKCTSGYTKWRLIWENGKKLICPIPGASTHCVTNGLAYFIDWRKIIYEG